jgi:hypothetical protein
VSTPAATGLVVVRVRDQVNSTLAGHSGREYTSPPQPRADALTLIALLLGAPAQTNGHKQTRWSCALAGGQRTITLDPAPGPTETADEESVTRTHAGRRRGS